MNCSKHMTPQKEKKFLDYREYLNCKHTFKTDSYC